MRSRAVGIGATIEIDSGAAGTTIGVTLPADAAAAAPPGSTTR
jgi:signal transduction histidine kinase